MENKKEGTERLFPSEIIVQQITIDSSCGLNLWEPMVRELKIEVGPYRMISFFFMGKNSDVLKYIFSYKRIKMQLYRLHLERKINFGTLKKTIFEMEERFLLIENSIMDSIDRQPIEDDHKKALQLILKYLTDKAICSVSNGSGKHRPRTTILEDVEDGKG